MLPTRRAILLKDATNLSQFIKLSYCGLGLSQSTGNERVFAALSHFMPGCGKVRWNPSEEAPTQPKS